MAAAGASDVPHRRARETPRKAATHRGKGEAAQVATRYEKSRERRYRPVWTALLLHREFLAPMARGIEQTLDKIEPMGL